jgi:hypothetical protein
VRAEETAARLAALREHLAARGLDVELDGNLIVRATGADAPRALRVTCRERDKDGRRLWFFTHWGEPLAEAGDVIGAAVAITGLLTVRA